MCLIKGKARTAGRVRLAELLTVDVLLLLHLAALIVSGIL